MLTDSKRPTRCLADAAATRSATPARIRSRTARPSGSRLSFILWSGLPDVAESIARLRIAGPGANTEPTSPLLGRAKREGGRRDAPARVALQPVVADRLGGGDPLLDVAGLEHVVCLICVMRPNARVAVRLQLERDLPAARARS